MDDYLGAPAGAKKASRTRDKQVLVDLFWRRGLMGYFRRGRNHQSVALFANERLRPWDEVSANRSVTIAAEEIVFILTFVTLGHEQWAYVEANGVVVVPPFEFVGYEFLPSQAW